MAPPLSPSWAFASVQELGAGLRRRAFTSLQLTEFYLDRLHRFGPRLNAVVTFTDELARQQARRADQELAAGHDRGPLHGIPYGAKDLLDTAGIRTTWGAPPFANRVPATDATVVARLRAAGAVLLAKLAMVELGGGGDYRSAGAALTGPARNPWDAKRWTGGSSSGSGAAVAGGLVGFAIGTETWGSIINPSTYCGIAGLRPTYGRVSRAGAMTLSWTLDKVGPMARRVGDLPLILAAIAGPDPADDSTLPQPFHHVPGPPRLHGLRLGFFPVAPMDADPAVKAAYLAALDVFRGLGATLVETSLPEFPYSAAASTILDVEAASAFEPLMASPDFQKLADEGQKIGLYAGTQVAGVDYLRAMRVRRAAQRGMADYLQHFDALLVPGEDEIAPLADVDFATQDQATEARRKAQHLVPVETTKNYQSGGATNLLGMPGVAVRMGISPEKMPIGLEVIGAPLHEDTILHIAAAFEAATRWHTLHPAMRD